MGSDVLQLLKIFISVHIIVYGVGRYVMGPDILQLLKTFTNGAAGDGTEYTTAAENIYQCSYYNVWNRVAGYGTECTTNAENIHQCPYYSVWNVAAGDWTSSRSTRTQRLTAN